jgi:IS605 OrfB family transposase
MRVSRIAYSKKLNQKKLAQLELQAKELGIIRSTVWHEYGSIKGVGLSDRGIRDQWLKEGKKFSVSANAWKETLRDAFSNIKANREAAKAAVRKAIVRHTSNKLEQKELFKTLRKDEWTDHPYLRSMMRKKCCRGHNHSYNQIIVRSDNYKTFSLGGKAWIKIPGLEKGKRIAIGLNTNVAPSGTLRLILKDGSVEVHYSIELEEKKDCGTSIIGVDKGYTEVLVDSEGEHHGTELGDKLSSESDYQKQKYQRRNKLRTIAKQKSQKWKNINKNNLGRKKLEKRQAKMKKQVENVVYKAVHAVASKASTIVAEDLTAPMCSKKFGKNVTRRLGAWTKGVIAKALEYVSKRRGSTLVLVNAAYTSRMDSRTGALLGYRKGDAFYCVDGEVLHADENAARNIQARFYDEEISQWTPYKKVKSILLERTERLRLGLLNQDSSCNDLSLSTESELPNGQLCPTF